MKKVDLSFPQFLFVVMTRGLLGAGVGLLLSGKLARDNRRRIGLSLVVLGALTTLPSVMFVRHGFRVEPERLIA